MMGGSSHDIRLNKLGEGVAGAFAGGLSRFLVTPLDVLKIHFQLQIDPASATAGQAHTAAAGAAARAGTSTAQSHSMPHYRSLAQATAGILRDGGLRGLWRGTIPATALWISYMAVQFPAYRAAQQTFGPLLSATSGSGSGSGVRSGQSGPPPLAVSLAAGGVSGVVATVLTYPLDWLRTRMAAQAHLPPSLRTTPRDIITHGWRADGARAYFGGLAPSLLQVVPSLAVTFATYEHASALYDTLAAASGMEGLEEPAPTAKAGSGGSSAGSGTRSAHQQMRSLFAGALAGVAGKLAVYPLDTVKKRLQMQSQHAGGASGEAVYAYRGTLQALARIAREEGVLKGWYKGTTPSLLKAGAAAALTFWSYEGAAAWLRTQSWAVEDVPSR